MKFKKGQPVIWNSAILKRSIVLFYVAPTLLKIMNEEEGLVVVSENELSEERNR